jgi:hypothetical protein
MMMMIRLQNAFPGFYVLGDSLVDVGNNNYIATVASAQSLPFGIDFPSGPTGRFSNGKILIDFLGIVLLPIIYLLRSYRSRSIDPNDRLPSIDCD